MDSIETYAYGTSYETKHKKTYSNLATTSDHPYKIILSVGCGSIKKNITNLI